MGWPALLLRQFQSVLVLVLVAAAGLSVAIAEFLDAAAIAAILVLNAVLGFAQEFRADRTLAALRQLTLGDSTVVRDGTPRVIPQTGLVPGNLIELDAGTALPADARLVPNAGLSVTEASLTGESTPVVKRLAPVEVDAALADRSSMVHRGTLVLAGRARAVVTATGADTELGRVAHLVAGVTKERSPLEVGRARIALGRGRPMDVRATRRGDSGQHQQTERAVRCEPISCDQAALVNRYRSGNRHPDLLTADAPLVGRPEGVHAVRGQSAIWKSGRHPRR